MGEGITITVSAETAAAVAKMQRFFGSVNEGMGKVTGATKFFEELGSKIAAAFTIGSVVEFTREAINAAEGMGKIAEKTGLAIETLAGLKKEAHAAGVPFEELGASLSLFSDKVFGAVRQGGQAGQAFRDLGIELVTMDGALRPTDKILGEVAEKFKGLPDGPQKAAAAMDLFGRAGREMIPILNHGAEGLERIKREGGGITPGMVAEATRFNHSLRELTESFEGIFRGLAVKVLPKLQELVEWMKDAVTAGTSLTENLKLLGAVASINFTKGLVDGILEAAKLFGTLFIETAGVIAGTIDRLLVNAINGVINWLNKSPRLASLLGGSIQPAQLSDNKGQVASEVEAMNKGAEVLRKLSDDFFNKGIAAAKEFYGGEGKSKSKEQEQERRGGNAGANVFPENQGAKAPVSEEAKKLIEEIDKAYAEATKGKAALLDAEAAQLKKKVTEEVLDRKKAAEEIARIDEIYGLKKNELLVKEKQAEDEINLARIEGKRALVEGDPDLTKAQKKEALLVLLRAENELIERNIVLNRARVADERLNDEAHLQAMKQLEELEQKKSLNLQASRKTGEEDTFGGEFRRVMVEIGNEWGSWAKQMADSFSTVFHTAISSVSNGITGLIMGTKSWGQALMAIENTILTSIVQAIVEMGVKYVATHGIMAAARAVFHAVGIALGWEQAAQTTAQQASIAPGLAVNAANQSTTSYGAAAIIGIAAMVAAIGIGIAAATGAFAEGGRPGVGQLSLVGERGPELFVADRPGTIIPAHVTAEILGGGARSKELGVRGGGNGSGGGTGQGAQVNLAFFDDQARIPNWARGQEFETHVVDIQRRNLYRMKG